MRTEKTTYELNWTFIELTKDLDLYFYVCSRFRLLSLAERYVLILMYINSLCDIYERSKLSGRFVDHNNCSIKTYNVSISSIFTIWLKKIWLILNKFAAKLFWFSKCTKIGELILHFRCIERQHLKKRDQTKKINLQKTNHFSNY